jgi:uncharacterized protein YegL
MKETEFALDRNDLIENPTPRCACALVLDTSSSMDGEPIRELNAALAQFIAELRADDFASYAIELCVVTFGSEIREQLPFTPAYQVDVNPQLTADGATPMGEAVSRAVRMLEARKTEYKRQGVSYYQPWLVLMSDGAPTDDWHQAAEQLRGLAASKKLVSLPVGIGGADLRVLGEFSNRPAKPLTGLKFREFFVWLSQSMARVSQSTPGTAVKLPATSGWDSI